MFDDLRAGDGARFTVASKNELLGGTQKVVTEAIRSRPSTSRDLASLGITLIARLPGIYGNVNSPCPRATPSDSGRFTTINPRRPGYNYYINSSLPVTVLSSN